MPLLHRTLIVLAALFAPAFALSAPLAAGERVDARETLLFESAYRNFVLAGRSPVGDVALVAGTHSRSFPYVGTAPWDNGLLWVGGRGYHFSHRANGGHLIIRADLGAGPSSGTITYRGPMTRAADGTHVHVDLRLSVALAPQPPRQLGRLSEWLIQRWGVGSPWSGGGASLGMRWRPASLSGNGTISVGGSEPVVVDGIAGELEDGQTRSFASPRLAFAYDYVALAAPEPHGYAFVDFVSHALDRSTALGRALDAYVSRTASVSITIAGTTAQAGNVRSVVRPPAADGSVVLFENRVDLSLAVLRRQMIVSRDGAGRTLYGLREIFEKR